MKVLFACGGTAGHINPAIAVATELRRRVPDCEILFVGNPDGMEATLVPQAGFCFAPFRSLGIQRRLTWSNIKLNAKSVCLLATARARANKLLREFAPDVVMGTGSYISAPILLAAAAMHIPCMTHEANALPGVSNRMVAQKVDKFLIAVPEAEKSLPPRPDYIVTGNPVRPEILAADRKAARARLGVLPEQVCLLSFGGSLGAQTINEAVADLMAWHVPEGRLHHIHATGRYGVELLPRLLRQKGVAFENNPNLDIRDYIHDMPDCLAAADLVIARAGAMTLAELTAVGRASVLIPSPNVAENHQYHNAMVLANHHAAVVIEEKELTGEKLVETVRTLTADPEKLRELGLAAKALGVPDACGHITDELQKLYAERKNKR